MVKDENAKRPLIPVEFIGILSCFGFYSFYFLKLPILILFLATLIFALVVFVFFLKIKKFNKTLELNVQNAKTQTMQLSYDEAKIHKLNKLKKIFTCIFVASLITFGALIRYKNFVRTPESLIKMQTVEEIIVELTSEPKPASRYYVLDCRLIKVYNSNGDSFSASGNAKIFFPKVVIDQNLSGGISLVSSKNSKAECKVFACGVILKAQARYAPNNNGADCFFAKSQLPEFLTWSSLVKKLRGVLRFQLMRLLFSWGAAGALLLALISADKNFLASEVNEAFINCGLAHVLALSGMHVSIVSDASEKLTVRFFSKNFTNIISLVAIFIFVWFAGSAPSLNRALGMAVILIFANLLSVKISILNALWLMFLIHLTLKPQEALSLSFQLSYGAVAGILIFGEAFKTLLEGKAPLIVLNSFSASFGAQAFTLPIVAICIKQITLIGLVSSSLVSPLIGYFLICGLSFVFLSLLFSSFASFFGWILNLFYNIIMTIVNFFTGLWVFEIRDFFTMFAYILVPLMLGFVCVYFQKRILLKRDCLARQIL